MTGAPLHIVHYLPRISLVEGGVVRSVIDLCAALAGANLRVTLLTHDARDAPPAWREADPATPTVVTVGEFKSIGRHSVDMATRALIARADAVHLHTPWELGNLALARCAQRSATPYIVSAHGMLDDWSMAQRKLKKKTFLWIVGVRTLERAAFVHCTAAAELAQARQWFGQGKGVVVPLVFDLAQFSELPGPDAARRRWPKLLTDRPTLLFLSRIHYKKGVEILIDSVGLLRDRGVDAAALIAGAGDEEYVASLKDRVTERGLADRVEFLGHVSGVEKISLYEAADVFVLPTSQENFGFVFFEAMACRTPVVTTRDVDTWPELEESSGAVVTSRDADSIADAVESLLKDEPHRREMGQRGRAWAMDRFGGSRVVEEYVDLYRAAAEIQREKPEPITLARLRQVARKGGSSSAEDPFWVSRYLYRPITIYFTWACVKLGLSANAVTLVSAAAIFIGAIGFGLPWRGAWLAGALVVQLYFILDHVDGELARYERAVLGRGSGMAGVFYDTACHAGETAALAAIALRLFADLGQPWWVMAALVVALFPGGIDPWQRYCEAVLAHVERSTENTNDEARIPAQLARKSSLALGASDQASPLRRMVGLASQAVGFPGYFVTLLICAALDQFPSLQLTIGGHVFPYLFLWLLIRALHKAAAALKSTFVYGWRLRSLG